MMRGSWAVLLVCTGLVSGCAGTTNWHQPDAAPASTSAGHAARDRIKHRIVLEALGQVGRPYRYGGDTPAGFDCSGLVQYVFTHVGTRLPRSTREQYKIGHKISVGKLEPGDLLFYRFAKGPVDHVAIYLGDGEAVHAPATGRSVIVASVDLPYWQRHFVKAVRVLQ